MKRFIRNVVIATAILGVAAPVAAAQDWPGAEEKRLYREARDSMLSAWYVAKTEVGVTFGTKPKPTVFRETFDVRAFGNSYVVNNYRSTRGDLATDLLGLDGTLYFPVPAVPDSVAMPETSAEQLTFRAGSPLYLPELDRIGAASFLGSADRPVNARGYYDTELVALDIRHDRAQELLAQSAVSAESAAAIAPKIQITTAHFNATIDTTTTPARITETKLKIEGTLPKDALGSVKDLWIVGEPTDMPLTLTAKFTPLGLERSPSVARPKRTITAAHLASTIRARAQLVTAIEAIEKYGKAKKTVYGMTAADVRKIDKKVKLVKGRGTTKAGTVGYTMMDKGRRYAVRATAANGWTYTAVRPVKGKFTKTCARAGGASCGTW